MAMILASNRLPVTIGTASDRPTLILSSGGLASALREYHDKGDGHWVGWLGDTSALDDEAWYVDNADDVTHPVAAKKPNEFGLYDMLGNVWEWCEDRHGNAVSGEQRDPVMRGGSWRSGAFHCTSVAFDPGDPNQKGDNIGFRVCCLIERP